MSVLSCTGSITQTADGVPVCSGSWQSEQASEFAGEMASASMLTGSDFNYLASVFVGWFVLAFAVKLVRRMFNT